MIVASPFFVEEESKIKTVRRIDNLLHVNWNVWIETSLEVEQQHILRIHACLQCTLFTND